MMIRTTVNILFYFILFFKSVCLHNRQYVYSVHPPLLQKKGKKSIMYVLSKKKKQIYIYFGAVDMPFIYYMSSQKQKQKKLISNMLKKKEKIMT